VNADLVLLVLLVFAGLSAFSFGYYVAPLAGRHAPGGRGAEQVTTDWLKAAVWLAVVVGCLVAWTLVLLLWAVLT
jgi:hypothetical protein